MGTICTTYGTNTEICATFSQFYSNNCRIIKVQQFIYICDIHPTCFGLLWPSSGRWLTKERVGANYGTDVQL
jgi:hypothetical protein